LGYSILAMMAIFIIYIIIMVKYSVYSNCKNLERIASNPKYYNYVTDWLQKGLTDHRFVLSFKESLLNRIPAMESDTVLENNNLDWKYLGLDLDHAWVELNRQKQLTEGISFEEIAAVSLGYGRSFVVFYFSGHIPSQDSEVSKRGEIIKVSNNAFVVCD